MLTVYNTIINAAIIIGTLFNRWKISIAVVIGKIQDGTTISRLRLINLYKIDHNLILKFILYHKATYHTYQHNLFGENQLGTRPIYSLKNEALIDECVT